MSIIINPKQFLANKTKEVAKKAADSLASAAALSPKQAEIVEQKRTAYLSQKPDMSGEDVQELIEKNLGVIGIEVYKDYLKQLKNIYRPVDTAVERFDALNRIRYFNLTKWVTDSEEKNLDKMVNVYQVLSEENCNIALIFHRTQEKCEVTMGVVNTDSRQSDPIKVKTYESRLKEAILGNFPGAELTTNKGNKDSFGVGIPQNLQSSIRVAKDGKKVKSVAIVSNLASEKSENFISQSIEKLLDGIIPQNEAQDYTIVLMAKPINNQNEGKTRLFELYSTLAPYTSWQTNYTYTESDGISSSANFGVNLGVSAGMHAVVNTTTGKNMSTATNKGSSDSIGGHIGGKHIGGDYHHTMQRGTTDTTGINSSKGISEGYNVSANFGVSFSRSSNVTAQVGTNEGITQTYTNYGVKHTLEVIEKQLKRMEESSALGMWSFAAYFIADSPVIANNAAHMYLALTQGEESFMTSAAINLWDGEYDRDDAQTILASVQKLQHPVFGLKDTLEEEWLLYPTLVTPSAVLSGKELARALNFPRKSVSGLPVLESAAFAREVHKFSDDRNGTNREIEIGNIYHMRKDEESKVKLDVNSLSSHVFVTGSTGTGKSNSIYQMLTRLHDHGVNYLVIEPAKGEYKKILGKNCKVYGTNIRKTEVLRTNPFSFPSEIHVLEHIDRLVEIFNACWPMYAAMPAVLKDAIEKSYEKVGWNLGFSKCTPLVFPTFADLIETLPEVMNSSLYSADTKSDYSGALITRVQSLTNGINGQIFCSSRELSDEELFKSDVIIDLSRVGSTETKSLLMGILVMKLQEYRLHLDQVKESLLHVTVLEEAHNLLRRTSVSQSQEDANLQGKAVEMLTNSIAEMRAYGEGFIIADQAPALLDEAVIRNTNTKVAFRLPDEADRTLVGSAMALSDRQIIELAKLPQGVAAVYQNDWVEAVLCHFKKYDERNPFTYQYRDHSNVIRHFLNKVFNVRDVYEIKKEDADMIKDWIFSLRNPFETKNVLLSVLKGDSISDKERELVAYNVYKGQKIYDILRTEKEVNKGIDMANDRIRSYLGFKDEVLIENIRRLIMQVIFRNQSDGEIFKRYHVVEEQRRLR